MSKGGLGTFHIGLAGSIKNVIRIDRDLRGWKISRLNMDDALNEAVGIILEQIRSRFERGVDANGVPWVPSQNSLRRKSKSTLWKTGRLYLSIREGASLDKGRLRTIEAPAARKGFKYGEMLHHHNNWQFLESGPSDKALILGMMQKRFPKAG